MAGEAPRHHRPTTYQLLLVADADPGLLAKVANALLVSNRLPRVVTMLQHGEGDVEVAIELDYADAETAARIVRTLWRVISIRDVSLFGCSASGFERIDMP